VHATPGALGGGPLEDRLTSLAFLKRMSAGAHLVGDDLAAVLMTSSLPFT
jgi:hypothetical protein